MLQGRADFQGGDFPFYSNVGSGKPMVGAHAEMALKQGVAGGQEVALVTAVS